MQELLSLCAVSNCRFGVSRGAQYGNPIQTTQYSPLVRDL